MSQSELDTLKCLAEYVEIDFHIHGFLVPHEWDTYIVLPHGEGIEGATKDVPYEDTEPVPAATNIRTDRLRAETDYSISILFDEPAINPSFSIVWVPSFFAGAPHPLSVCLAAMVAHNDPAWCIFPISGKDFTYGVNTIQLPDGRLPFDGVRRHEFPLDGWWLGPTPDDGSAVLTQNVALTINVHAEDSLGSGLNHVDITWATPGQSGPWTKITRWYPAGTARADFRAEIPVNLGPYNEMLVSFDIHLNNGRVKSAPQGVRRFCRVGTGCSPLGSPPSGGSGGVQPPVTCTPGQYQVAVFTDPNYGGNCVIKDVGTYNDPGAIGLPNDSISSIKIGSGSQLTVCDNAGINSPCEWFIADDPDLSNNTINTNTISSLRVEGNQPTTGCNPSDTQVSFFEHPDWTGLCITKNFGVYNDPGAIGLPNDSISSIKVGARAKVRVCDNAGMNSPCEEFDQSDPNLNNNSINSETISAAEVYLKGGIRLCDGTNQGGECKYFGTGYFNLQDYGFNDRTESIGYDADWAGRYHIVLYAEPDQTGALYHADNSVGDLQPPYNNNITSIHIYKHTPPGATLDAPADGTVFPANTASVTLNFDGGDNRRVHIWGGGIDRHLDWTTAKTWQINDLTPGTYQWQVQARGVAGDGAWSSARSFGINTAPVVVSGDLAMNAGTVQSVQIQAEDVEHQSSLTLSASGLPAFAAFTDNGGGVGVLALTPAAGDGGQYVITVTASDGSLTGTGIVNVQVSPPPVVGYQATYFNNLTLSGTPALSRDEASVDYDWGGESPGGGVNPDNFSARWTKTTEFDAGDYTFSVTADDGVRLYVDGALSIDEWIDQGSTTYTVDKTLTAGSHTIVMEYYERGGGAVAKLSYQTLTVPTPAPGIASGNTYKLINPNSDKALDVDGGTAADGTNVHIWTDNGSAAQKWLITRNADGTYKLINPGTSRALDVDGGGTADGTNVQIWTDNDSSAQKWLITQNADGSYKLVNPASDKALDISGAGTADGINVQIWTDNNSAAQRWQIIDVGGAPPPASPTFTGSGSVTPASLTAGSTVTMNAIFTSTSATESTTRIHLEIRNPSDQQVYTRDFDNETFTPGQTKTYTATWTIPQTAPAGNYVVKGGAVSADWGTWYQWLNAAGSFTVAAPSGGGTELLTSTWNLSGNNGASERYQTIASSALAGKTTLRITYNLHGLQALGGDASAIIFDQNGWKYVSLSGCGQNGLDGSQTVDIPLSAFGLDLNQPVGTLHTRFWYGSSFTVDVTSITVL